MGSVLDQWNKENITIDSDSEESACNAGDSGSIPGSGRSPGEGNGYPLQYSCLENSMDREGWRAIIYGSQGITHDWATTKVSPVNFFGFLVQIKLTL